MKNSKSIIGKYETEVRQWRSDGMSYRTIAKTLSDKYSINISHTSVVSFLNVLDKKETHSFPYFPDLPKDIQTSIIKQFITLWTHDSTAIEGNTLTLGETSKVLEYGLTISGKPLREHEEVYGHAKAIELILDLLKEDKIYDEDLFNLHRCVMQKTAIDSLRPVGDWKKDFNGTTGVLNGEMHYMQYASPTDTPKLMTRWLKEFNRKLNSANTKTKAINVYTWCHLSFVRIHPFFDGNGRVARLISNLPLMKGGLPPILISPKKRTEYIDLLWNYENAVGQIRVNDRFLQPDESITKLKLLLKDEWHESYNLITKYNSQ
ncbi:MAG: Fic family protein [Kiritimatiellae bacterium]|jgi:Fic family protein|nr:Fic family protein [Kiritimatiellia bacterium]